MARDPRAKQTDVYAGQQARLNRLHTEREIEHEVARFARLGRLLEVILNPALESDIQVRRRLQRLNAWGTTTVYPLLLHLLDRREQGEVTSEQAAAAMLYVESFFVRRLLTGRATNNLNRILLSLVTEMSAEQPADEAVRAYLSTGRKYYASDDEIRVAAATIPYYLNGRPRQRALVLGWLEESYASKEPVDPDDLTLEHVLPQTPTVDWNRALAEDLQPGEDPAQVYEALVHTLGNLTLTGYNSALNNSSFAVKRPKLATSGVAMNQEIAQLDRWGRRQILDRAHDLADCAIRLWPGPVQRGAPSESSVAWDVMNRALAEIPAGAWTTYGDLAALIGSHPVPVGVRLASHPAPNAHRVLQTGGTVSPGFRWLDPRRCDDPLALLRAEGVLLDDDGRAHPSQRITPADLAQLAGINDDDHEGPSRSPHGDGDLHARFLTQLDDLQTPETGRGVRRVLAAWIDLGGHLDFGAAGDTSCFLMARDRADPRGDIWPVAIYPSGRCEVVFQYLTPRAPFGDPQLREELRQRLNSIPGVDLPASKIELRPRFGLTALADSSGQDLFIEQLAWFLHAANKVVRPALSLD